MIDAVAWKYEKGCPWRELPARFGPWQIVYHRYTVWAKDGTWQRIHSRLRASPDTDGDLAWLVRLDATLGLTALDEHPTGP
ncbi:transposase [Embleya sp. AB8]